MQLKPGDETTIDGQRLRYLGDGKFEAVGECVSAAPAGELLAKRFDVSDSRPMGGLRNATESSGV